MFGDTDKNEGAPELLVSSINFNKCRLSAANGIQLVIAQLLLLCICSIAVSSQ